jgi:hypothetical protein
MQDLEYRESGRSAVLHTSRHDHSWWTPLHECPWTSTSNLVPPISGWRRNQVFRLSRLFVSLCRTIPLFLSCCFGVHFGIATTVSAATLVRALSPAVYAFFLLPVLISASALIFPLQFRRWSWKQGVLVKVFFALVLALWLCGVHLRFCSEVLRRRWRRAVAISERALQVFKLVCLPSFQVVFLRHRWWRTAANSVRELEVFKSCSSSSLFSGFQVILVSVLWACGLFYILCYSWKHHDSLPTLVVSNWEPGEFQHDWICKTKFCFVVSLLDPGMSKTCWHSFVAMFCLLVSITVVVSSILWNCPCLLMW